MTSTSHRRRGQGKPEDLRSAQDLAQLQPDHELAMFADGARTAYQHRHLDRLICPTDDTELDLEFDASTPISMGWTSGYDAAAFLRECVGLLPRGEILARTDAGWRTIEKWLDAAGLLTAIETLERIAQIDDWSGRPSPLDGTTPPE